MNKITLDRVKKEERARFVVKLRNADTQEVQEYPYLIERLSNKTAVNVQLLQAEFARDKDRDSIVGSKVIQSILATTTPTEGNTVDLIDIFDEVSIDALVELVKGLTEAAKSSTVGSTEG